MTRVRNAPKSFRSDPGLAQTDVAKALHIGIATVIKRKAGKTAPGLQS